MRFSEYTYTRPDLAELERSFKQETDHFVSATDAEAQIAAIHRINALRSSFDTMAQMCGIRHSVDTNDAFYTAEQAFFDESAPLFEDMVSRYYAALLRSPFRTAIEEKFGAQLFRIAEMQQRAFKPEIIEDLIKENKLSTQYQELIANALIPFRGGEYALSEMVPFTRSIDRATRKEAAEARWAFFSDNAVTLDSIFDALVHTRHTIAQKLGFENFIPVGYVRMLRSDYDALMVRGFREQVLQRIVPLATELRKKQAQRLGLDHLLYYDEALLFRTGNATPKGEPEWIIEQGRKMYAELSPETNEFFAFMLDRQLMDLVAKKGKAGGGYCTYISGYRSPFIFSNFNGTSADIDVLTHEVGHAFQVYMSRGMETMEYYWPTSDAAEIHSMSMEYFAYPWMDNFFNGEADKYRYAHLVDSVLFLPYGVAVDAFQHEVYAHPEWTAAERKTCWRAIEKKFVPHRDYGDNTFLQNGGYWQTQAHIYQSPFYYIDYTLAQMCAFQFWLRSLENKEAAFQDYVKLCKAGGSRSFLELVEYANLRSPFEKEVMAEVVDAVESYLLQTDDARLN